MPDVNTRTTSPDRIERDAKAADPKAALAPDPRRTSGNPEQEQSEEIVPLSRRIVRVALRPLGARVGLFWIGLVYVIAVFAPVLANSFPLAVKKSGSWSSPMLERLTPADVT